MKTAEGNVKNQNPFKEGGMKAPESPSEITVEWLRGILRSEPAADGIVSMEMDDDFGPISLLGKAVRVKIDHANTQGEPKSVIVKFQVNVDKPKRESEIYRLLLEAGVKYIPRMYGAFGSGHLVLEDLSSTHSVMKNGEGMTTSQAHHVVTRLADIHGRFWGDARIPKDDVSHFENVIKINMGQSWEIFKNRYLTSLGEDAAAFEWMLENAKTVSEHHQSGPTTLTHGDVNRGNLLFPNDGSDEAVFIDWQLSGQRVAPFDLSYFLLKELTVEQRRGHEEVLLNEYYRLLPDYVQTSYSFDRLRLDYRACVTRSMVSAVMNVGPRFSKYPDQFERADRLAERIIAAIHDLKPVEAIHELQERGLLNGK